MQTMNEFKLPDVSNGLDEIVIDIVGNVDSGKSSLCSILSHPKLRTGITNNKVNEILPQILDNGNGSARDRIVKLKHERESGRTSTISYNYMVFDELKPHPKIVSLVDLAGHYKYLKTTVSGVVSSYPEYGLVLIAKNITHMTHEHYSILVAMGVPILFVITKIDSIPAKTIASNIMKIKKMCRKFGKNSMLINDTERDKKINTCITDPTVFGYIKISNKTGTGLSTLIKYISCIKKKEKKIVNAFAVGQIYPNITGFGMVVSGINGCSIKKGDSMFIGPFDNGDIVPIKIRTIHNDYKTFVDELKENVRGCLCIRIDAKYKPLVRSGMFITHTKKDIVPVKNIEAIVAVFRGKSSNIKVGYTTYINIGMTKGSVKFTRLRDEKTGDDIDMLNTSKRAIVNMELMKVSAIVEDCKFLFRSDRVCGIGKVLRINPT